MKLSALRSAIRSQKGNPTMEVPFNGKTITLTLQKTALLESLGEAFANHPDGRAASTGIDFTDGVISGLITPSGDYDAPHDSSPNDDLDDDLDDDLGI